MTNTIILLVIFGLLGFLYTQAKKYGNGDFLLGLSRYFNLNYEKPEVETARIHQALIDLYDHLDNRYGPGWRLTMLNQDEADNQIVIERLYKRESLPSSFSANETVWSGYGNKPEDRGAEVKAFLIETVLEPRQKEN